MRGSQNVETTCACIVTICHGRISGKYLHINLLSHEELAYTVIHELGCTLVYGTTVHLDLRFLSIILFKPFSELLILLSYFIFLHVSF